MKNVGYTTGQFDKNHLGDLNQFLPTMKGVDEGWGRPCHLNAMEYASDPGWPDDPECEAQFGPRNIVHAYATETVDDTVDPRWGVVGLQDVIMKELDDNVGLVLADLADLADLGVSDNMIVVFTSGNGPETMTWPDGGITLLHGEKGTSWEGGFCVPAIIRWPGQTPEGQGLNGVFDGMDWMPTLVAPAGGPEDLPAALPGGYEGYRVHLDG